MADLGRVKAQTARIEARWASADHRRGTPPSAGRPGRLEGSSPYTAGLVSQRPFGCLFEIVETLVLTLVIFLVIQNFVAQPYRVQQQSMEHTLEPDQYVLVDKLTARFDDYKRGDIVVFNPPAAWAQRDGTPFIKRVIGVGGDTISIKDNRVYVNGIALDEPYIFDNQGTLPTGDRSTWVIAPERAVRDGRPPCQLRRFARLRADREEGRDRSRVVALLALQHVRNPPHADASGAPDRRSMSLVLLAASVTVVAGGIASIAGRRPLLVVLGTGLVLGVGPLVSDPALAPLPLAARAVGAVLAAEILWIGLRDRVDVGGPSALSPAALALIAAAAFVVGFGAQSGGPGLGPPASLGTGLAVFVLGVAAAVRPDPIVRGLAAVLFVAGAELVRVAIAGPPSALEAVVAGALGVALCAGVAVVATSAWSRAHHE